MKKILGFLVFTSQVFAATKTNLYGSQVVGVQSFENILGNPSFEKNLSSWTASGGSFALSTSAKVLGNSGATWDSSSASQTLISTAVTIPDGLKGRDAVLYCSFKAASGTATHLVQAYDGTNILNSKTITSDSSFFRRSEVNFVFPSSGNIQLRLVSVAADEPSISIDDCYLGLANNLVQSQANLDWRSWTPTGNWSSNVTWTGQYARLGDTAYFRVKAVVSASGSTGNFIVNFPTGIVPDTTKIPSTDSNQRLGSALINDNASGTYDGAVLYNGTSSVYVRYQKNFSGVQYFTTVTETDPFGTLAASDSVYAEWSMPVLGWTAQNSTSLENANWKVDANVGASNFDLGTSSVSTYTGITSSTGVLTNNAGTGNITAQIPCSSTNSPSGTTCSAGSESVGVAFTPQGQFPQDVLACASFSWNGSATAGSQIVPAFQIVETPINAQSISQEGRSRISAGQISSAGATQDMALPFRVCGTFTFTSGGQKALRLFYEQLATGTVTKSTITADESSSVGQRDIHWEVYPVLNSNKAPVLIGGVTSNSTTSERIERASFTCSASSSVTAQSGSWLSIGNVSSGNCGLTFTSGYFSSAPTCVTAGNQSDDDFVVKVISGTSTSGVTVRCYNSTTGADASSCNGGIICMGPR